MTKQPRAFGRKSALSQVLTLSNSPSSTLHPKSHSSDIFASKHRALLLGLAVPLEQTTLEHHVPRSLSGSLPRRPECLWHRGYGRWLDGWAYRRLPLRRMQCARLTEERRSDPLQGLRAPCALQGENEEVSLLPFLRSRDSSVADACLILVLLWVVANYCFSE